MDICIISAKDLLKNRQKIIELADQSEHGWRTVAEYETNPIASNSDIRGAFIGLRHHELQEKVDQTQMGDVVDVGVIPIRGLQCIEGQQKPLEGAVHRHKRSRTRGQIYVLVAQCLDTGSLSALV